MLFGFFKLFKLSKKKLVEDRERKGQTKSKRVFIDSTQVKEFLVFKYLSSRKGK